MEKKDELTAEEKYLKKIAGWRRSRRFDRFERVGRTIQMMEERIAGKHKKVGGVVRVWEQMLPANLGKHCRIDDLKDGSLKVVVDNAVYANELRWCSSEVLELLKKNCPAARISRINIVVGSV